METLNGYLTNLASERPVPGGGSAAMLTGAAACALTAMVARITGKSPHRADALRERLQALREADEAAYARVVQAQHLPRGTEDEKQARTRALQETLAAAATVPLRGARNAAALYPFVAALLDGTPPGLVSDLGCAAELAHAAVNCCAYNVRVNHRYLRDDALVQTQEHELARIERESGAWRARIRYAIAERNGATSSRSTSMPTPRV